MRRYESMIASIQKINKTVYLTIGYRWKSPTVLDVPMTAEQAVLWIEENASKYALIEMKTNADETKVHLNAYTANDMW